jgi:DNA polymerase (family 10)
MRTLDQHGIAEALREIALLLRFRGEDFFRSRAYDTAADAVDTLREDLGTLVAERRLTDIPSVGSGLAAVIAELYERGESRLAAELRRGIPRGFRALSEVSGLGPKKIMQLHEKLAIDDVEDLERACELRQVRTVPGFGEKTERRILEAIRRRVPRPEGHLLLEALEVGADVVAHLRAAGIDPVELAGSTRRAKEIVGDVDVVAASDDPKRAIARLRGHPAVAETVESSDRRCRVRLAGGPYVDLAVGPRDAAAAALVRETGSRGHVAKLEALAAERGLALREEGLVRIADGAAIAAADEREIYEHLGLPWIAPELREDTGEVEAALDGMLPEDLVSLADVRGLVHCHTVYSDGKNTIEEMAHAADVMGMQYLTITDHSPTASYAGGVEVDRLRKQWDEIARVQESVSVRILRGTESDILADGALDYPDEVIAKLDVVVASIHGRMKMDVDQMTARIVAAMRHPMFKIWGHALGRLLRKRPPIECRVEEVLDAIAESRAAIEVNGDPYRLDLEPRWIRAARERSIPFVLSTDAHSTRTLANVRFAVAMARRGWLSRGEVLNTLSADDFVAAVRPAA